MPEVDMGGAVECHLISDNAVEWEEALDGLRHDIYHTRQFMEHAATVSSGEAVAFVAKKGQAKLVLPLVVRGLPPWLHAMQGLSDAFTPPGYGGFLCTTGIDQATYTELVKAIAGLAARVGIVSIFLREHALFSMNAPIPNATRIHHGETVAWYLGEHAQPLHAEMRASHRNEIRWLTKNGYRVVWNDWEQYCRFQSLYLATMHRTGAGHEYLHDAHYFDSLKDRLGESLKLGTVIAPDGEIAAAALFFGWDGILQYHLSASNIAYQRKSPTKLLISECAAIGRAGGYTWLHLGGGVGASKDALYSFKAGFSARRWEFNTTRWIVRSVDYQRLVAASGSTRFLHSQHEGTTDRDFFPAYRREPSASMQQPSRPEPTPWPQFTDKEIAAVEEVLRSGKVNYWTGNQNTSFEAEYAQSLGVQHAIALTNGTAALELALYALGIGPGDEVIVPSRTFIASASAVVMRGAKPVIADIDPFSQNITAETLGRAVTPNSKAVIAVHVGGWPCDMDSIRSEAKKHGLFVIEDCAQAHGAFFHSSPAGTMGDVGVFSFCQDKIITTGGEGGLLVTDNSEIWEKAWSFKDHGKNRSKVTGSKGDGTFRFVHDQFGTNLRMTEMQAAIGRVQLENLKHFVEERRKNARLVRNFLSDCDMIQIPDPPEGFFHSYYRLYALLELDRLRSDWSRDRVLQTLVREGFPIGIGSCGEIYREQAFGAGGLNTQRLPNAALANAASLAFLVHPGQTEEYLRALCGRLRQLLSEAAHENPVGRVAA